MFDEGWAESQLDFPPIMLLAFGIGALNTSFVKDGEVSVPLSYVTGTLVKMGQGIERHIAGGKLSDWLGYFLLFGSFIFGATVGGVISLLVNGTGMLVFSSAMCTLATGYTYFHQDRRALLEIASRTRTSAAALGERCGRCMGGSIRLRLGQRSVSAGCRASWQPVAGSSSPSHASRWAGS